MAERDHVMEIREVTEREIKSKICDSILHKLPDWFGIESSTAEYVGMVGELPFYATYADENPVGFLAVKTHNPFTAEVCVMGVLGEYHRMGIGTALIERAVQFCRQEGMVYLTVKTLDGSVNFEPYERTRRFYEKMGFIPLEVFPLLWDEANPCLFLAKHLACCREKGNKMPG